MKVFEQILKINYKNIAIELTPSNAVKFTLILNEKLVLIITKPLQMVEGLESDHVIFSLFKSNELLISDTSKIDELAKGINKYLEESNSNENNHTGN